MKKLLAASIVLISAVALVGCGSKAKKETASEDYGLKNISFPLKKSVSLNILTSENQVAPKDPNDMTIFKRIEKQSNVKVNWTNYPNDFPEKRNLDIASGALPDAIFNAQASEQDLLTWAKNGVIVPLEDAIEKYMPNLQAVFKASPEYKKMLTAPDGHIYSLPWIEELGKGKESIHTVNSLGWINQKWLNKLGLSQPKTAKDLYEVLKAFKEKDPNGNGKKDEIPLSFMSSDDGNDLKMLFAAFGDGSGDNGQHLIVNNDGKVQFTANTNSYKEAIKYLNKCYSEGLIDTESFEQDWSRYVAKGADEKYGLYFTWDPHNVTGPGDDYVMYQPLAREDGKINVTRTNNFGFSRDRFVVTSANKNMELTAKWIDQMYAPVQSIQNNWGTYGEKGQNIFKYDQAANKLTHEPLGGTSPVELRQKTSVGGPLAVLNAYYGKYTTMPDDAKWRLDLMSKYIFPHVNNEFNYPNIFMSKQDTKRIADIDADMQDYITQKRDEWITKGNIDQEWDAYIKQLKAYGLDEWLKIKQTNYDNYIK